MKTEQKISSYPYLIIGAIAATLLALLNHYAIKNYLPSLWISLYGLMFLLAYPQKKSLLRLICSSFIPSFLASIPLLWEHNAISAPFSAFFITCLCAYALNAFHMHYQSDRFHFNYQHLFYAVWDTAIQLFIVFLFVLLCWFILYVCGQLFEFIDINLIKILIRKSWFQVWSSTFFVAMGLLITAKTNAVICNMRIILLLICRFLFVPLAIIGNLFAIGFIMSRWHHPNALPTHVMFLSIAFLSALFINGIYQDGHSEKPYPPTLFWICQVFLWITPLFSLIALHGIYYDGANPIHQNGFDTNNFPYFIATLLLLTYNSCYAFIAMRRENPWFRSIQKINIVLATILIIVTVTVFNQWNMKRFPTPHFNYIKIQKTASTGIKSDKLDL